MYCHGFPSFKIYRPIKFVGIDDNAIYHGDAHTVAEMAFGYSPLQMGMTLKCQ
jgi:hypothetical protein